MQTSIPVKFFYDSLSNVMIFWTFNRKPTILISFEIESLFSVTTGLIPPVNVTLKNPTFEDCDLLKTCFFNSCHQSSDIPVVPQTADDLDLSRYPYSYLSVSASWISFIKVSVKSPTHATDIVIGQTFIWSLHQNSIKSNFQKLLQISTSLGNQVES